MKTTVACTVTGNLYDDNAMPVITESIFNIKINGNIAWVSCENGIDNCYHYLGIEIGVRNNTTQADEILEKYPANETYKNYGNSEITRDSYYTYTFYSYCYDIDFSPEKITVPNKNSLFIRFKVKNDVRDKNDSSGSENYEKIVWIDYNPYEKEWKSRDNTCNFCNIISTANITSPEIEGFSINNNINYQINIEP